jgi:light-regulated signal transduction histidine kinase (bacteriophytochrome)
MTDKLHEAIVKAALERAADVAHYAHDAYQGWGDAEQAIRHLASDPAEVAAIISAAAQLNKEQSDEEDRG